MSSAATRRSRKRRGDDAHESAPAKRRRRLLCPSNSPSVRSFGPSKFSPVRSFGLRVSLATGPRLRRKRRVVAARHPIARPLRRRRHNRLLPRARYFPGLRPFALRFLLATGAPAPRRRRKPALVDMGNYICHLLRGDDTSDDGLEPEIEPEKGDLRDMGNYISHLLRGDTSDDGLESEMEPEKGDLVDMGNYISQLLRENTNDDGLESELEAENGDVMRTGLGDWSVPAFELPTPPEKWEPPNKQALESEWTQTRGGRLTETELEARYQELPGVAYRPDKDLSDLFKPLTDKEETEVDSVLHGSGRSDEIIVMHEPSNIEVTKEKLQCLRPRGWLNDEVINLYMELLKERAEREPERFLKCHFFNTFFYKKLTCGIAGYDYQSVRRWTTFKKLGYGLIECEKIFVPIHREAHWCLAVINMKDKTFQYLDSLGGMGHDVLRVLARYIMDELKDKSNMEIDISSWMEVSNFRPLQQNTWDCGMFMLKYIDFHSRGLKPFFSQEHMVYFRKRTAKEIMRLRAD